MKVKNGFTLIELLVVIAIIGLLSSVILASLSTARMKARDARRLADIRQIKLALELYYDAKGYYPGANWPGTNVLPACSDTPIQEWDCNGRLMSYVSGGGANSWDTLQTELAPYLAKLPRDPINSTCPPWTTASPCYSYAYGDVGRYLYPPTYTIYARLETPNHPQNCANNNYTYGRGYGQLNNYCGSWPTDGYLASP